MSKRRSKEYLSFEERLRLKREALMPKAETEAEILHRQQELVRHTEQQAQMERNRKNARDFIHGSELTQALKYLYSLRVSSEGEVKSFEEAISYYEEEKGNFKVGLNLELGKMPFWDSDPYHDYDPEPYINTCNYSLRLYVEANSLHCMFFIEHSGGASGSSDDDRIYELIAELCVNEKSHWEEILKKYHAF